MINYSDAIAILQQQTPLDATTIATLDACGYVIAETIVSQQNVPSFANSAMDGFAVHSKDLINASQDNPITMTVMGSIVAGDAPISGSSSAWEIMTGAPLPEGYDAVIKIEDVRITAVNDCGRPQQIVVMQSTHKGNNIRYAGEDFMPRDTVVKQGTYINPFHIMALTSIGQNVIRVAPQPKVVVFSTGKEVSDDTSSPLLPGAIRNTNGPYLMATLNKLPVRAHYHGVITDVPELFEAKIQDCLEETNIFISTGAVSAGRLDFIPQSLRNLGAEILFHKAAIRPGKPILYARFSNGAHYFGLPGNPVSACVGLRFFVIPLVRHIQGMSAEKPQIAKLMQSHTKKPNLRFFRRAETSYNEHGQRQVRILPSQESFKIKPFLSANCWAIFTENQNVCEAHESIMTYPLEPEL